MMDLAFRPRQIPHQSFFIRSELGQLEIRLDWQTTREVFLITVRTVDGVDLITGKLLANTVNIINGYPELGAITLAGKKATLTGIGVTSELRWMDLDTYQGFIDGIELEETDFADLSLFKDLININEYNIQMLDSLKRLQPYEQWRIDKNV